MSVYKYDPTLLFLIKGHSKQLPLLRLEVRLNQVVFLLGFEKCDLRPISQLLVGILAQPIVLILLVLNTTEYKKNVSCSFKNLIDNSWYNFNRFFFLNSMQFYVSIFMRVPGFLFEHLFVTIWWCEPETDIIWGCCGFFFLVPENINTDYETERSEQHFFSTSESRK